MNLANKKCHFKPLLHGEHPINELLVRKQEIESTLSSMPNDCYTKADDWI